MIKIYEAKRTPRTYQCPRRSFSISTKERESYFSGFFNTARMIMPTIEPMAKAAR